MDLFSGGVDDSAGGARDTVCSLASESTLRRELNSSSHPYGSVPAFDAVVAVVAEEWTLALSTRVLAREVRLMVGGAKVADLDIRLGALESADLALPAATSFQFGSQLP